MGVQVSITINFSREYSPVNVLELMLDNGWGYHYENRVSYLSSNEDDYNWQDVELKTFNLNDFIKSHAVGRKVGLVVVFNDESGGELLIYPGYISFSLSINRKYLLSKKIPDFNWYLKMMASFLEDIK